jgi:hypothetical protein
VQRVPELAADPIQRQVAVIVVTGSQATLNAAKAATTHLLADDPDTERIQRIMRAAFRPKPRREPEEVYLVDRVQQRGRRPLDDRSSS